MAIVFLLRMPVAFFQAVHVFFLRTPVAFFQAVKP